MRNETAVAVLVGVVVLDVGVGLVAAAHAGLDRRAPLWRDRWTTVMVLLGATLYGLGLPAAAIYARSAWREAGSANATAVVRGVPRSIAGARCAQRDAWSVLRAGAPPPGAASAGSMPDGALRALSAGGGRRDD